MTITSKASSDVFAEVVGQASVKRKLNFFLTAAQDTGTVPPLLFPAAKGVGKTFIAKEFRKGLYQRTGDDAGQRKPLYPFNCATIKNAKQFFNWIISNRIQDKEVTILLDESHKLPNDLSEALLTVLQPNKENKNSLTFDDYVLEFDMARITWMFCTSEVHKMNKPLVDRLERVELEEYTVDELAEIVRRNLPEVQFDDGVLETEVVPVLRGNARSAQKMAGHIKSFLGKSLAFFAEDWAQIKLALGINPLGLTPQEIKVLRILAQHKETSLTRIAAVTGMSPEALRQDVESSLQRLDLMAVTTLGRSLTPNGHKYLQSLAVA